MLRSRLVVPPAPPAVAAAAAPRADAVAEIAVAADAMLVVRPKRSVPGTTTCRQDRIVINHPSCMCIASSVLC
jgi:hypothetical protein